MSYQRVGRTTGSAQADMLAVQREVQVFQLRAQGYTFDEIAHQCGYANSGSAVKAYKRALARIPKHSIEEMRANIFAQQLIALKAMQGRIARGDHLAIREMTAIHERMCKLFGLDTPQAPPTDAAALTAQVIVRAYPQAWAAALPSVDAALPAMTAQATEPAAVEVQA